VTGRARVRLWNRQLVHYPEASALSCYLAVVIVTTIVLGG